MHRTVDRATLQEALGHQAVLQMNQAAFEDQDLLWTHRERGAVHIQLLTALIRYLPMALYKRTHGLKQNLWDCRA